MHVPRNLRGEPHANAPHDIDIDIDLRSPRRPCTTGDADALASLRKRWQRLPRAELKSHTSTSGLPNHAVPRQKDLTTAAVCKNRLSMGTMANIVRCHQRDSISTAKGCAKVPNNATWLGAHACVPWHYGVHRQNTDLSLQHRSIHGRCCQKQELLLCLLLLLSSILRLQTRHHFVKRCSATLPASIQRRHVREMHQTFNASLAVTAGNRRQR
jgi:hypothetical protein